MCEVDGCPYTVKAKGFCLKHYTRLNRGKNPHDPSWYDLDRVSWFWTRVIKNGGFPDFSDPLVRVTKESGECWLWPTESASRYGTYYSEGRSVKAYRFAFESEMGTIPDGLELDHLCRNPQCVRPAHLEAVTHAANIQRAYVSKLT